MSKVWCGVLGVGGGCVMDAEGSITIVLILRIVGIGGVSP